eukprot:TRINITY_DN12600_c4_g1_i1.p1 TRINITY_DN12600_c4_g1~~TRINITY_DN12600_c4_g1_i1.p1  ORF type:complete len:523 (-),score=124.65 TRINITY_DN12600_c4_g1_i1:124-1692(-)
MHGQPPDRAMLAQRIQGFGNVNPPPLEEETAASTAKKAVGRLGEMVGEEVMLTVEDFREKGAVGAVKDAVADAGDILIDGVSGIIGWIRGDPPGEEENEKAEDATKALSFGPNGAAYGISQASPTGGINAVWVMPEEADPAAMAQLAAQGGGNMVNDPRVPKNIQPYQPPASSKAPAGIQPYQPPGGAGYQIPGGPVIAPYQPAPSGPGGFRAPPYIPGGAGFQAGGAAPWGPGGYSGRAPGYAPGAGGASSSSPGGNSGAKGLVDRLTKGEVLVGPDVVKRLVSQCNAAKTTSKQLADIVCERTRRLYLGLDGGDPADADAALARLLSLTDALKTDSSDLAKSAVEEIKKGVSEEFLSLRSSAKHQAAALPMLQRLGMVAGGATASPSVDLLGGGGGGGAAQEADLLGGVAQPAAEVDLLGGGGGASAASTNSALGDLLGGAGASSSSAAGPASLDPLAPQGQAGGLLAGLTMPAAAPVPAASAGVAVGTTLGTGAVMKEAKKEEDIFGFVGAEMSKANKK